LHSYFTRIHEHIIYIITHELAQKASVSPWLIGAQWAIRKLRRK